MASLSVIMVSNSSKLRWSDAVPFFKSISYKPLKWVALDVIKYLTFHVKAVSVVLYRALREWIVPPSSQNWLLPSINFVALSQYNFCTDFFVLWIGAVHTKMFPFQDCLTITKFDIRFYAGRKQQRAPNLGTCKILEGWFKTQKSHNNLAMHNDGPYVKPFQYALSEAWQNEWIRVVTGTKICLADVMACTVLRFLYNFIPLKCNTTGKAAPT